jgi:uncharacterized RDD family membrane protein YckC
VNDQPIPYAGLVSRTLAFTLDGVLVTAAILVTGTTIGLALSLLIPGDTHVHLGVALVGAGLGIWWLIMGLYLACFWILAGQTPGMRVMRLQVSTSEGGRMGPVQALVRLVGMVLAALPLMAGYALILLDDRRQGLHDKLARSFVLYVAEEAAAGPERFGVEPRGLSEAPSAYPRGAAPPGTSALP